MKILISPIGIYVNRVMKGIANIKPDVIYLCTMEHVKGVKDGFHSELYGKWEAVTEKYAKKIMKNLKVFYDDEKIRILRVNIDDYLSAFKDLFKLILSFDPSTEVFIDTTSTTHDFKIASITLSIYLKNVKCIYTPAFKPLFPEEYKKDSIDDRGLVTKIISTPKIDFSELQTGILKDILITMNSRFNGEVPSVTDLLMQLGIPNDKGNMIKMTKLLKKLENYGCVTTKKEGRIKKINLTVIGSSLSEILKNV
jgi:hypothetical protein